MLLRIQPQDCLGLLRRKYDSGIVRRFPHTHSTRTLRRLWYGCFGFARTYLSMVNEPTFDPGINLDIVPLKKVGGKTLVVRIVRVRLYSCIIPLGTATTILFLMSERLRWLARKLCRLPGTAGTLRRKSSSRRPVPERLLGVGVFDVLVRDDKLDWTLSVKDWQVVDCL